MAPAHRRYHTRVGPTPPASSHPRPTWRPDQPRGPGHQAEGSHHHRDLGPHPLHLIRVFPEPQTCPWGPSSGVLTSPATPSRGMSAAGIETIMGSCTMISRPLPRTWDFESPCSSYSDTILESFMVPRQYFYPRVVTEFYHTMTSRREANPTALHFSIDGRPGILQASDITAALHLPVVLANATDYRLWPHPSPREMVCLLSMDATGGSVLYRRHRPLRMLLIDHVLRSNMFPLQHTVQRR